MCNNWKKMTERSGITSLICVTTSNYCMHKIFFQINIEENNAEVTNLIK